MNGRPVSLVVDEHRQYLADQLRVAAFGEAISDVVKQGDVVLDLGAGTGILGLLACRAGAGRVYSVEEGAVIEVARETCRANRFEDRMVFLKGLSTRVSLPERVDVVLADQIGPFGFEAGIIEYFADARRRFLKHDGVMIPSRLDLWVAPVECPEMWDRVDFWSGAPARLDFGPARALAINTGYHLRLCQEHLLGQAVSALSLNLLDATPTPLSLKVSIVAERAGTFHGVGGWFSARLSPTVIMSNSPLDPNKINRPNVFFPIDRPVNVVRGDVVRITMRILPIEVVVVWNVEVWETIGEGQGNQREVKKAHFTHSTWQGMLLCQEDLRKTRPQFVPKLSPWGEARLSVLTLCDGRRPLREIEEEILGRHPELFRSPGDAEAFVAGIINRNSE